jgi:hypothetical protein
LRGGPERPGAPGDGNVRRPRSARARRTLGAIYTPNVGQTAV